VWPAARPLGPLVVVVGGRVFSEDTNRLLGAWRKRFISQPQKSVMMNAGIQFEKTKKIKGVKSLLCNRYTIWAEKWFKVYSWDQSDDFWSKKRSYSRDSSAKCVFEVWTLTHGTRCHVITRHTWPQLQKYNAGDVWRMLLFTISFSVPNPAWNLSRTRVHTHTHTHTYILPRFTFLIRICLAPNFVPPACFSRLSCRRLLTVPASPAVLALYIYIYIIWASGAAAGWALSRAPYEQKARHHFCNVQVSGNIAVLVFIIICRYAQLIITPMQEVGWDAFAST
jgi:hypothetical protein